MKISDRAPRTPNDRTAQRRRRLGASVVLVFGLLLGLLGLAPSASAHRPEIAGTVACGYRVEWTASSWTAATDGSGDHPNVVVEYQLNGTGAWTQVPTGSPGAFELPETPSFSGSFVAPGDPTSVTLRGRTVGPWGNGYGKGETTTTGVLTFPTGCTPPSTPSATALVDCAEDEIVVLFTGVGAATTVDIRKNGVLVGDDVSVPVGPSSFSIPLVAADENTAVTITLDYAAATATDQTLVTSVDCSTPAAPGGTITWTCGSDVRVDLTNAGQESTEATITRNGSVVATVAVPPGGTSTTFSPSAENTTMVVVVTFADEGTSTDLTESFTVDCDRPAPTIGEPVCQADGGLDVVLGNEQGTDTARFTVTIDGEETTVVVAAGETQVVNIAVAEDATVSLTISSGEVRYSNATLARDCQKPAAEVAFACAAGGVVVTLTNAGSEAALVDVAGELVEVPAGTTAEDPIERLIAVAEGSSYSVTVLGETAEGTRDCERPGIASVQIECDEGGVAVFLTNEGTLDTIVTVDGVEVIVPAGTTAEAPLRVVVPVAENAVYDFQVLGGELDVQLTGTLDCLYPAAEVDDEVVCAKGGLSVILRNPGDDTAEVTVSSPVLPEGETTVTVEPGVVVPVFLPLAEEASTTVTVTAGDEVLFDDTVTRDCEVVLPGIVDPPDPVPTPSIALPRTGSEARDLVGLGGILLLAGTALVLGTTRRSARLR